MADNISIPYTGVGRALSDGDEEELLEYSGELTLVLAGLFSVSPDDKDIVARGNGSDTRQASDQSTDPKTKEIGLQLRDYGDDLEEKLTAERHRRPNEDGTDPITKMLENVFSITYDMFEDTCTVLMTSFSSCFRSCRDQIAFIFTIAGRVLNTLKQGNGDANRQREIMSYAGRYITRTGLGNTVTNRSALEMIASGENDAPFVDKLGPD